MMSHFLSKEGGDQSGGFLLNRTEHMVLSTRGGLVSLAKTNYQCKNDNFTFSAIGITIQDT